MDRWVPTYVTNFNLHEFGGTTRKPIHVFTNFLQPLLSMDTLPEHMRQLPGQTLGSRVFNAETGRWHFTGDKKSMKESSAYPMHFGDEFVRRISNVST